jgi:hypothetical protein
MSPSGLPLFTGRVHVYQDNYGNPIDRTLRLLGVAWDVDDQARATARLVLGTDTGLVSTLRRAEFDTQDQWIAGLGAAAGSLGWGADASGPRSRARYTNRAASTAPFTWRRIW